MPINFRIAEVVTAVQNGWQKVCTENVRLFDDLL